MKITSKLTIAFVLFSLVPLTVLGFVGYFMSEQALTRRVIDQLDSVASNQEKRIESMVEQHVERIALVTSRRQLRINLNSFIKEGKQEYLDDITNILTDIQAASSSFEDLSVFSLDGEVVASTNRVLIGKRYQNEEFFTHGKTKNNADIIFLDEQGNLSTYSSGPLVLDGKLLGVVAVTSDAASLLALVTDYTGLGETGEMTLSKRDENGDALSITPLRFDLKASLRRIRSRHDTSSPIIQALLKNERVFTDSIDYRGQPVLAATRYLDKQDWGLSVKIDRAEAFAPIADLRNLLLFALAASSIMVGFFAYYLAGTIARPLLRLTDMAGKIGAGDLSQRAIANRKDEIGVLGQALNQMADNLSTAHLVLEQKVEERTVELARSNAELEQFAYVASHDLQEPLRKIQAFGSRLQVKNGHLLTEDGLDYLERMQGAAARMQGLINDLLTFSRVGKGESAKALTDLNHIVRDVVSDLEVRIEQTGGRVEADSLPAIIADASQMRQLMQNLIGNALKFRQEGQSPLVKISSSLVGIARHHTTGNLAEIAPATNEWHKIEVEDNGIGFDEKYLDRVFTPFQRLHSKSEYEGTGIGLAVCRRIVERHGGTITASSESGKGSIFTIILPVAQ